MPESERKTTTKHVVEVTVWWPSEPLDRRDSDYLDRRRLEQGAVVGHVAQALGEAGLNVDVAHTGIVSDCSARIVQVDGG